MIKTVLFDLDGTMLPLDMEKFMNIYFSELAKRFCPVLHVDAESLVKSIWVGTKAMGLSDGKTYCKDRFWNKFAQIYGQDSLQYVKDFDNFYETEFLKAKEATWENSLVAECISLLKEKEIDVIAATNPIFPYVATKNRIEWAGLTTGQFRYITSYENSKYCKPDIRYYQEILDNNGLRAEECLMVGNDVDEDMCAGQLGMQTFLLTDCLIARDKDFSTYEQGSFADLKEILHRL